jgi:hypothetical protein
MEATAVEEIHLQNEDQMQVVFEEKNLQQLSSIDPFTEKVLIGNSFPCSISVGSRSTEVVGVGGRGTGARLPATAGARRRSGRRRARSSGERRETEGRD